MHKTTSSDPGELRCSFCHKGQPEVRKLIAGPSVFICNECVEVCVDIVAAGATPDGSREDSAEGARLLLKAASAFPNRSSTCSVCGKSGPSGEMLDVESRGSLCGECADAIENALRQGRPTL